MVGKQSRRGETKEKKDEKEKDKEKEKIRSKRTEGGQGAREVCKLLPSNQRPVTGARDRAIMS